MTRCVGARCAASERKLRGMSDDGKVPGHVGLALSGGGSRAAAFHRGTLQALHDLGLVDLVERVSTVSGGSVFGAAWMAARAAGVSDHAFLQELKGVLERGFIWPALLSPRLLRLALPGYSRTHRLAETFDSLVLRGKRLSDLPKTPKLVMNTTALNHAQNVRFSREGVSGIGIGADGTSGSLPFFPLDERLTLGFATAASAAFPFGLPPLVLERRYIPGAKFVAGLSGLEEIWLTDGGVLENLGVQTLLRSGSFAATHVIVSDAGLRESTWRPGDPMQRIKSAGIYSLSPDTLGQLLLLMNNKQNKSMRQLVIEELTPKPPGPRRVVLMLMASRAWEPLLTGIKATRLAELAENAGFTGSKPSARASAQEVRAFLESCRVDLTKARRIYDEMGGDAAAKAANEIPIHFTPLSAAQLDLLASHARWQLHATAAIYGPIPAHARPRPHATNDYSVRHDAAVA
jgi:predicted acylesterase/phospholipase RssA